MDISLDDKEVPSIIEIKVLFFAGARDATGITEMPLKVACGSTAHDCLNKLVSEFPGLKEIQECIVLALNEEYASELSIVKERDELAIIPPISGGWKKMIGGAHHHQKKGVISGNKEMMMSVSSKHTHALVAEEKKNHHHQAADGAPLVDMAYSGKNHRGRGHDKRNKTEIHSDHLPISSIQRHH